jgi:hypothetical protein
MDWVTMIVDGLFVAGAIAALGFIGYGMWLAIQHGMGSAAEGRGRFAYRHRRRVRTTSRDPLGAKTQT